MIPAWLTLFECLRGDFSMESSLSIDDVVRRFVKICRPYVVDCAKILGFG